MNIYIGPANAVGATWRAWLGLALIFFPCMLYSIDSTILNLAIPSLSKDLSPTGVQLLWIVDIYGFVIASLLISMGVLGDRIGHRRLLLLGAAAFAVDSILAATARSTSTLILARGLLGSAGATIAPATLSIIRAMFSHPRERAIAIGVWTASYSVGAAVGPVVGGLMIQYIHWRAAFLLAVPVSAAVLLLGPVLLPEYKSASAKPIDIPSVALSFSSVMSFVYGVKWIGGHGLDFQSGLAILVGVALAFLFVHRQRNLSAPMVNLRLLRSRTSIAGLISYSVVCFAASGASLIISQYMQVVLGLTPVQAGLWTLPYAITLIVGSAVAAFLSQFIRPVHVLILGLSVSTLGFALMSFLGVSSSPVTLSIIMCTYALGVVSVVSVSVALVLRNVPADHVGIASGITETASELGSALGIAILGSIGAAVFRTGLNTISTLSGGNRSVGTIGEAVELAHRIGGPPELAMLLIYRTAFVRELNVVAMVTTAMLVAVIVFVLSARREVAPVIAA